MRIFLRRLSDLVVRHRRDQRLDAEVSHHLALLEDDLTAQGMTPETARLEARRQFGGVDQMKMRYRDRRGVPLVDTLMQDARFAVRVLVRDRWSAAATIVALAIGMGGAATMLSLLYSMNFRALPFDDPNRLVAVRAEPNRAQRALVPFVLFEAWRDRAAALAGLAAHVSAPVNLADDERATDQVSGTFVSHEAFTILRQRPILGRDFLPEDDRPGVPHVALIGYRVWVDRFGSDPAILGRRIRANGEPATVVGVMPDRFMYPIDTQIWLPLAALPVMRTPEAPRLLVQILARLAVGSSAEQARGELAAIASTLTTVDESDRTRLPLVMPLNEAYLGAAFQTTPMMMIAATFVVLLIGCSHAASLLIARSAARTREVAMRATLGASRSRLVRQLLVESMLMALAAGLLATAMAWLGMDLFAKETADAGMPYWTRFTLDAPLVLGLTAFSVLVGVAFGLLPAFQISRANLSDLLGQGGRAGTAGPRTHRTTSVLLVGEMAMTIVLLANAGALVQSATVLNDADQAIDLDRLWEYRLSLPQPHYASRDQRLAFYRRLDERLAAAPGMESAALASSAPFIARDERAIVMEGETLGPGTRAPTAHMVAIGPRYFETLGLRIVGGRGLDELDGPSLAGAALVNERFVERFSPGARPIGREVTIVNERAPGSAPLRVTIVGIAPPLRQAMNVAAAPVVYVSHDAEPPAAASIVIRGRPDGFAELLRREVRRLDPDLPLFRLQSLERASYLSRWIPRIISTAFSMTAIAAALLSALGLYSITAYSATQRTREIGVRMALGATRVGISWLFLRQVLTQISVSIVLGLAGAVGAGMVLQGLLVDLRANDPMVLAGVSVFLAAVAIAASLLPALRAARLDPAATLRAE